MTHAGRGSNIDLSALWVSILPETSHMAGPEMTQLGEKAGAAYMGGFKSSSASGAAEMRQVGEKAQQALMAGFKSGGGFKLDALPDPEKMGNEFGKKFTDTFNKQLSGSMWGRGIFGNIVERTVRDAAQIGEKVNATLANSLQKKLPGMLKELSVATDALAVSRQHLDEVSQRMLPEEERRIELNNRLAEATQRQQELTARAASGGRVTLREYKQATDDASDAERGLRSGSGEFAQMEKEKAAAVKQHNVALKAAEESQKKYNSTLKDYNEASASARSGSTMLATVMGGALVLGVQGVISGFEGLIHLGEHLFEDAIHGAEEIAHRLVDIGEEYDQLEIQIREFSGATGEAFEAMNVHVKAIFGTLDVAGKNLGETYAKFSAVLNAGPSPALDALARSVTELQGRFSNLKTQDIASIFYAFHTPIEETNDDLGFLLQSAQNAGQGMGDFAGLMEGQVAETLASAGLSIRQAALFTGEFAKTGLPARQAMMGLAGAMQAFTKAGLSFPEGMKEAKKELDALANNPAAQDKRAEEIFGSKWAIVQPLIAAYLNALNATGPALDVPINKTQDFLNATQDLGNKIDEFKHKAEDAFAPFGKSAVEAVEGGLSKVSDWFTQNQSGIADKIQSWGDKFIDMLPEIKHFVASAIDMLGPFTDMLASMGSVVLKVAAGFAALTFHFGDAEDFMKASGDLQAASGSNTLFGQAGGGGPIDKFFGKIKDQVDGLDTSKTALDGFKDSLRDATDAMRNGPGSALPGAPLAGAPGSTGGPSAPGYNGGTGPGVHVSGPAVPGPSSPNGPPGPGTPAFAMPGAPLPAPGGATPPLGIPGAAPSVNKGAMASMIYTAVTGAGYSSQTALYAVAAADYESSLSSDVTNPSAHHGLFQESSDKPSAGAAQQIAWFVGALNAAGGPAVVNADPKNVIANSVEKGGYSGSAYDAKLGEARSLLGFNKGGESSGTGNGLSKLLAKFGFGPKGKDTELGWYTPGEFVVTEDTMEKHGPLIRALQGKGGRYFAGGGTGSADAYASNPGGDDTQGVDAEILGADAVAHGFGLRLTAGKSGHGTHDVDGGYHDSGMAGDFSNGVGTPQEASFAMYMAQNYGGQIAELIHYGPGWDANYNIKDGKFIRDYGGVPKVYDMGTLNGHQDHVHVAMKPGSAPSLEAMAQGGAPGGGSGWAGASATPAGWGGGGGSGGSGASAGGGFAGAPYGPGNPPPGGADVPQVPGESWDEWISRSQRMGGQQQRQLELQSEYTDQLNARNKLQGELDDDLKKDVLDKTKMTAEQRASKQQEIDKDNEALGRKQSDIDKAAGDANIDAYKAGEPAKGGSRSGADDAARTLGSSFMSGLSQSLGFPDIFGGKAPWEWGSVKMLGGLATYALSGFTGAKEGRGGKVHQPENATGMLPNLMQGATQSSGFPALPGSPLSLAPGTQPPAQTPMPQVPGGGNFPLFPGGGPGRAPGPAQTPNSQPQPQLPGNAPQAPGPAPAPAPAAPAIPPGFLPPASPPAPGGATPPLGLPGSAAPISRVLPAADLNGPNNFADRYAPSATPQGFPGGDMFGQLATAALGAAGNMLSSATKGGSFQSGGGGSRIQLTSATGGSGQGQPLGASGMTMSGGVTHSYNAPIDNSTTYNITPKTDSHITGSVKEYNNGLRDNSALASHMVQTP
jgi:hypothetical protein